MVEFIDLEFGAHGFLINHVFLPTEQAEKNICWIIYQDATFKICLSLFGWKENIVPKMHIVQCGPCWALPVLLRGRFASRPGKNISYFDAGSCMQRIAKHITPTLPPLPESWIPQNRLEQIGLTKNWAIVNVCGVNSGGGSFILMTTPI